MIPVDSRPNSPKIGVRSGQYAVRIPAGNNNAVPVKNYGEDSGLVFRWDTKAKEWSCEPSETSREVLSMWAQKVGAVVLPEARVLAGLKPGGPRLLPELIPSTSWGANLREQLGAQWKPLAKRVYDRAGRRCEACGRVGPKWPVEAHELWTYDQANGTQTLVRLVALCPPCHQSYHLGFASTQGKLPQAVRHLALVNGWHVSESELWVEHAFEQWSARSRIQWNVVVESEVEPFSRGLI